MHPRRLNDSRRTAASKLLASAVVAVMTVVSAACTTTDALRESRFAVENNLNVYLVNGTGRLTEVVRRSKVGATERETLWDAYFQPALAPDGSAVACIRFRNYTRFSSNDAAVLPRQSSEVVVMRMDRTEKPATRVIHSLPGEAGVVYRLSSPIWSRDGRFVFFLANHRLFAHSVDTAQTELLSTLPDDVSAGFSEEHVTTSYLRLSPDGNQIFALLRERDARHSVWRIDWPKGSATRLWQGSLYEHFFAPIRTQLPSQLGNAAVDALFGSRAFPVLAPRFSADQRFYFFVRRKPGVFGRLWIGGYDVEERKDFVVRTLQRGFMWK